jgi:hypothetical protein
MSSRIQIESCDGGTFILDREIGSFFTNIDATIGRITVTDNGDVGVQVLFPCITSKILNLLIEWVTKRRDHVLSGIAFGDANSNSDWIDEFLPKDHGTLFDLLVGAYHLKFTNLQSVACIGLIKMLQGKSLDEVRHILAIDDPLLDDVRRRLTFDEPALLE